MSIDSKFETFYIQVIAAECDSGHIFLPESQYVDPAILNKILEGNNPFPCNVTGKMERWTTNPDLQAKSEFVCINYVSQDGLKDWGCTSLLQSLVTDEYESGAHWDPQCLSVTWSDGDQEAAKEAIANYLDAAPSQADIDEYKRLKAKLGL